MAAIYTAFLFGQAEGRDLWQTGLLPVHLVVQALMVGSGVLLLLGLFVPLPEAMFTALAWTFVLALVVDLFVTLFGEFGMPHASEIAARASHQIRAGKYRHLFWWGAIAVGHVLPLALVIVAMLTPAMALPLMAVAAVLAIAGLYCFEHAFVFAPQEIPNS